MTMRTHTGLRLPHRRRGGLRSDLGGIISAGGVGFDISCGIRCLRTPLTLTDLLPQAEHLASALFHAIPAGVGEEGDIKLSPQQLDHILLGGAVWAVEKGYGVKEDLQFIEEHGCVKGAVPGNVSEHAKKRQRGEMGTLGSATIT